MDISTIILFISLLIIAGIIAGYTSGLFGIGGGIVLVPTFATVLPYFNTSNEVVMHVAIATSLALIIPASFMAARKQHQQGMLDKHILKPWLLWIIVGVVIGVILLPFINTFYLKVFFTLYLFICLIIAIIKEHPKESNTQGLPQAQKVGGGMIIGSLSVLLGIGGGTFMVPLYTYYKYPIKKAIALSSATGFFIGLGGTLGAIIDGINVSGRPLFSLGYVNILAFILITPLVMMFAPLGAKTANTISKQKLKWIYTFFILFVFCYMVYKLYP